MAEFICKRCEKVCKNLRGWKTHMSAAHGGFSEEELSEIASGSSGESNVKERMSAFASQFSDDEKPENSKPNGSQKVIGIDQPSVDNVKRVKATPKKLKKILGGIPAKILEQAKTVLDDEDREALDEASEFLADCFGFEFSVPESKITVESRWWALGWVGAIVALIYLKHHSSEIFASVKAMGEDKSSVE